jgi:oleandomycin transport system ATP-binding protein
MAAAIAEAGLDGVAGALADPAEGVVSVPILSDEQLTAVVGLLGARGFGITHIDTHLPSLDEVFLAITGQKADPPTAIPDQDRPDRAEDGADGRTAKGADERADRTGDDKEDAEVAA